MTVSVKPEKPAKKKTNYKAAWAETRKLMWQHRGSLAAGMVLMLFNRLSGLVLPGSMLYSAVIHPLPCPFIHGGTLFSTLAVQRTVVPPAW